VVRPGSRIRPAGESPVRVVAGEPGSRLRELLTIDEALATILEKVTTLSAEPVPIQLAAGRVVAEAATAVSDLPPFPSSAMDGFALRAEDTPATLPIAFEVAAGTPAPWRLPAGSAAAISTGGAVPDGADSVAPVEQVKVEDGSVMVPVRVAAGAHVRPRGGDVVAGAVVTGAGTRLGPAQIGALAAAGVAEVRCVRRPRAAVLVTGSELRRPGEKLGPGQIYESNGAMIAAVLASLADVEQLPIALDEEAAHREALERGLAGEVLVTSGGVSMGTHDLVRKVAFELGVEEVFWGVAVKPGKPLSFGVRGDTLVFGLPGNPVSSLVGSLLFVRPALLALQGAVDPGPDYESGRTATPLRRNAERDEFLRARRLRDGDGVLLQPVAGQESHMIVRAASADALVHVPRGEGEIAAGSAVRYLALS
jgi:molybdopterin molybdotransferase